MASTSNNSTVAAEIGSGSTIWAGAVTVTALHDTYFAASADSVNVAFLGGSGAKATNDATNSSTVTIGDNVNLTAAGMVSLGAENDFVETSDGADSASAGAGGVVNGLAAVSHITLGGTASVNVGTGGRYHVRHGPPASPGGIVVTAASTLSASDFVTLTTGGLIQEAGIDVHS